MKEANLRFIRNRLSRGQIFLGQESKLFAEEGSEKAGSGVLDKAAGQGKAFYNNAPENVRSTEFNRAGTFIIASGDVVRDYVIDHTVLAPGHIQAINCKPKDSSTHSQFIVVNVYLSCYEGNVKRLMSFNYLVPIAESVPGVQGSNVRRSERGFIGDIFDEVEVSP